MDQFEFDAHSRITKRRLEDVIAEEHRRLFDAGISSRIVFMLKTGDDRVRLRDRFRLFFSA